MKELRKAGLLTLYGEFIEKAVDGMHRRLRSFADAVSDALHKQKIEAIESGLVGTADECRRAMDEFAQNDCQAVIILFLTYAPSLNFAEILINSDLPIIFLDTTPVYDFCSIGDAGQLMYNHGIHGMQDLCSVLKRNGKQFTIEAGHWSESDVVQRVYSKLTVIEWARSFREGKVGILGKPMDGMGDFRVSFSGLEERYGSSVEVLNVSRLAAHHRSIDEHDIDTEFEKDTRLYSVDTELDRSVYNDSCRTGLALRRYIKEAGCTAVAVNNIQFGEWPDFETVPFFEYSKLMAMGTGYAGEGDVVTALLAGVFICAFPRNVSFTEMFCPDWKYGRIVLSHAGEVNPGIAGNTPRLVQKQFAVAGKPATMLSCRYKEGNAVLLNLIPCDDGRFTLVAVPGMVEGDPNFSLKNIISGLFRPTLSMERMLEQYSVQGGTHHQVLLYDCDVQQIEIFAGHMSWSFVSIE